MSSLGLGLVAADSYFREGDHRREREKNEERFGWERDRHQYWADTAPSLKAATINSANLRAEQSDIDLAVARQTRDNTIANAVKKTEVEGKELSSKEKDLKHVEDLRTYNEAVAKIEAKTNHELAKVKEELLPYLIADLRRKGLLNYTDGAILAVSKLGQMLPFASSDEMMRYWNAVSDTSPDGEKGERIVRASVDNDPVTGEKVFSGWGASGKLVVEMSDSVAKNVIAGLSTGQNKMGAAENDAKYRARALGISEADAVRMGVEGKQTSRAEFMYKAIQDARGIKPNLSAEEQNDIADNAGKTWDYVQQQRRFQPGAPTGLSVVAPHAGSGNGQTPTQGNVPQGNVDQLRANYAEPQKPPAKKPTLPDVNFGLDVAAPDASKSSSSYEGGAGLIDVGKYVGRAFLDGRSETLKKGQEAKDSPERDSDRIARAWEEIKDAIPPDERAEAFRLLCQMYYKEKEEKKNKK